MRFFIVLLALIALFAAAVPSASAQVVGSSTAAYFDLIGEWLRSDGFLLVTHHRPGSPDARMPDICTPIDDATRAQAATQLNRFDQRATSLANSTTGLDHESAINLVLEIEDDYRWLTTPAYSRLPDVCYQ